MIIPCFHGSRIEVIKPDLSFSRSDIDFGVGFYLTEDETMAKKWACNKSHSVVNYYSLETEGLSIYRFKPDVEWLNYCVANRNMERPDFDDTVFDVLIGPTADDKLFSTLDMYSDGFLSAKETIEIVNCMKYSNQVVLKTQKAIDERLSFVRSKELTGQEKQHYTTLFRLDREEVNKKTEGMIKKYKSGR